MDIVGGILIGGLLLWMLGVGFAYTGGRPSDHPEAAARGIASAVDQVFQLAGFIVAWVCVLAIAGYCTWHYDLGAGGWALVATLSLPCIPAALVLAFLAKIALEHRSR